MTYDLKMALAECISVMGEHIDPDADYPREVLERARKLVSQGWKPMKDAPMNKRLIIADPERDAMTTWTIVDTLSRDAVLEAGWKLWQLAPDMPAKGTGK